MVPEHLLKIIACNCSKGCATKNCSCKKLGIFCTSLCNKCEGRNCANIEDINLTHNEEAGEELEKIFELETGDSEIQATGQDLRNLFDDEADIQVEEIFPLESLSDEEDVAFAIIDDSEDLDPPPAKKMRI